MDELSYEEFRTAKHRGPWIVVDDPDREMAPPIFEDWACYAPGRLVPGVYRAILDAGWAFARPVELKVTGPTPDDWGLRLVKP